MRRVALLSPLFLCLAACGSDDTGSSADTGLSSGPTTGSGEGDGDGDGNDSSGFEPTPARGMTLTRVTANHGVNVSIANGTQWAGPTEREARLVTGRDTLFRVYYELDANWIEREIMARLEYTVGGESYTFEEVKTVVVPSSDQYLDGTIWFALPAESPEGFTQPDATFQVSLWEVGPGAEALDAHDVVGPADGQQLVGYESIPMQMNVRFVPFEYNGVIPDTADAGKMMQIENEIYQTEPIQILTTSIDDLRTQGANWNPCEMLGTMQQIWSAAGAPGDTYFVGLVDSGASSGILGCALINAMFNADLWINNNIKRSATSIVHEIGHNQGLNHVQCDDMGNPAAGPDPSYPNHPTGLTLNTGFGIRDFAMYPGDTTTDYMSYCNDRWVSPWTWAKVWTRIRTITEMGSPFISDAGTVTDVEPVIQFGMYASGNEAWWTALTHIDTKLMPGDTFIEFELDGQLIARERGQVQMLSDDASVWVAARLPNGDPEAAFDTVRYIGPAGTREVHRDEVSFYTDLDVGELQ